MSRDTSVAVTLGAIVVHFVVSLMCAFVLLSVAYTYEGISSRDDLWRLGEAPRLGFVALSWIGMLEALTAFVLLMIARTRRRAWLSPVVGIVFSVAATVIATSFFHEPIPLVGG